MLASINSHDDVFAQTVSTTGTPPPLSSQTSTTSQTTQNLYFINVSVDPNLVPNKPFTIYADIQDPNPSDLIAYISAPQGINVISPTVATPHFTNAGNTVRASWTLMAPSTGSFPITIIAHSNFPIDTESFAINVNVGSPHSLVITAINIPGNIFPSDNFTVGIKLKNTSIVKDDDVIAQISVPAGLHLLDSVSQNSGTINPDQEIALNWRLKAESAGSYILAFNYSSINSGPNFVTGALNVGTIPVATGALLSISAEPITLTQNAITQVTFDVKNNYIHPINHLQIVTATGGAYTSVDTPAWVGDLSVNALKKVTLGIYTSNQTLTLKVPVEVKYDSNGVSYDETYLTQLPLGNQPNFKISAVTLSPPLSFAGDVADKIDVQIFNLGQGTNDVYATLNLPDGLSPAWGNSTSSYFGRIDTFQTVTASFYVNIDNNAISGNHPLSLTITTGGQKTNLNMNFVVTKKANFQLESVDSSQLYPGATNVPFKITLKNIGTAPAQTLTTLLLSGNTAPGVKSATITAVGNQENIGTVLPNQVFTTTFLVALDSTYPSGDQSTSIEINWTQNSTYNVSTNNFVQTITVPYNVPSGPSYLLYYDGIPWTAVIGVAAFIVLIYIFIKRRKKRLMLMKLASSQASGSGTGTLDISKIQALEDISAAKEKEPEKSNP